MYDFNTDRKFPLQVCASDIFFMVFYHVGFAQNIDHLFFEFMSM